MAKLIPKALTGMPAWFKSPVLSSPDPLGGLGAQAVNFIRNLEMLLAVKEEAARRELEETKLRLIRNQPQLKATTKEELEAAHRRTREHEIKLRANEQAAIFGRALGANHDMTVDEVNQNTLNTINLMGYMAAPYLMTTLESGYYLGTGRPKEAALTAGVGYGLPIMFKGLLQLPNTARSYVASRELNKGINNAKLETPILLSKEIFRIGNFETTPPTAGKVQGSFTWYKIGNKWYATENSTGNLKGFHPKNDEFGELALNSTKGSNEYTFRMTSPYADAFDLEESVRAGFSKTLNKNEVKQFSQELQKMMPEGSRLSADFNGGIDRGGLSMDSFKWLTSQPKYGRGRLVADTKNPFHQWNDLTFNNKELYDLYLQYTESPTLENLVNYKTSLDKFLKLLGMPESVVKDGKVLIAQPWIEYGNPTLNKAYQEAREAYVRNNPLAFVHEIETELLLSNIKAFDGRRGSPSLGISRFNANGDAVTGYGDIRFYFPSDYIKGMKLYSWSDDALLPTTIDAIRELESKGMKFTYDNYEKALISPELETKTKLELLKNHPHLGKRDQNLEETIQKIREINSPSFYGEVYPLEPVDLSKAVYAQTSEKYPALIDWFNKHNIQFGEKVPAIFNKKVIFKNGGKLKLISRTEYKQ